MPAIAVRLSQRNVFLPDLSWFSPDQLPDLAATHAPLAPAWLCEVPSPRTADRDLGPKFAAYEEHGVQEDWVLDPSPAHRHQFFFREDDHLTAREPTNGWITSQTIPNFRVRPDWLDPESLPSAAACTSKIAA
jgi:Uma2 family endonuclease